MRDGKLVKTADVPEDVIEKLKDHASVQESHEIVDKSCLFCGVQSKYGRLVNLKTIYLCEEHYYDKSIGQIVQKINQIDKEKQDEESETR